MDIEKEIFEKSVVEYTKLIPYGFQKQGSEYIISKEILNHTFRMEVKITETGVVKGKIDDLSFQEEYTNYRIKEQTGEFVTIIRNEFENFLKEIRKNCFKTNYFYTEQANRITHFIMEKYHQDPQFLWEKYPGYGVFKNTNNKWYALIMNINMNKMTHENREVEILNVKLKKNEIKDLLKKNGFYEAYHMNKENWITILLDDTISDNEIMNYIEKSFQFTESKEK